MIPWLITLALLAPASPPPKPQSRPADLETVVADLAEQVAALRREVADLKRKIDGDHPADDFSVGMTMKQSRDLLERKGWAFEVHTDDRLVDGRHVRIENLSLVAKERRILNGEPYLLVFEDGVCVRVLR